MQNELLSYSRLTTFESCPRCYYYNYICRDRAGDNVYSYLGSIAHEAVEKLISGEIDSGKAKAIFLEGVEDSELLGLEFPSENSKTKYQDCILHFFDTFNPDEYNGAVIEEYFEQEIAGKMFRGYIDCYFETEDSIIIEDFKTSSKYSKKDLESHRLQLAIYAAAKREYAQRQEKKIILRFNMLKYAVVGKRIVERCELGYEDVQPGYVYIPYDDELHNTLCEWVKKTTGEIEAIDPEIYYRWKKKHNPLTDWYCSGICGFKDRCNNRAG